MTTKNTVVTCGCDAPHYARGLCQTCYRRTWEQAPAGREKKKSYNAKPRSKEAKREYYERVVKPRYAAGLYSSPARKAQKREYDKKRNQDPVVIARRQDLSKLRKRAGTLELRKYKLKKYGLSVADFDAMAAEQGNRCAICQRDDVGLCVDHCHLTDRVRGLLCRRCNSGIGQLGDDAERVARAAEYLRSFVNMEKTG